MAGRVFGHLVLLCLVMLAAAHPALAQAPLAPSAGPFTVVLDVAHGGDDAGATLQPNPAANSATEPEKVFVLAFSQRLRALLQARGMVVVTTRDADASVDANRRAEIANRSHARLCLSLHATQAGSGVHLFVSSLAPAPAERLLAWKTVQAAYMTRSLSAAGSLNAALGHASIPATMGRIGLPGLDSMACPAVAVEIAPVLASPHDQATPLGDLNYQTQVADALAAAVVDWRAEAAQP